MDCHPDKFRICKTCNIEKPLTEFWQRKYFTHICLVCKRKKDKEYRDANKEQTKENSRRFRKRHWQPPIVKHPIIDGRRECVQCYIIKETDNFYKSKGNYSLRCKECVKENMEAKVGDKKCLECHQVKPYSDFTIEKQTFKARCKECVNVISKERYHKDEDYKSRIKKSGSKSRKRYLPKRAAKLREWRKTSDKYTPMRLRYLSKHKEHCRIYTKKATEELRTNYVKSVLRCPNAPPELIELKRNHIKFIRQIKTITNATKKQQAPVSVHN